VLVLSGETTDEDVEKADVSDKPDFVFDSLDDVDKLMY
jgi:ribonucleotide monophosphatase NagD (HAD superfamily)